MPGYRCNAQEPVMPELLSLQHGFAAARDWGP
jgi:hypothetical protein